MNKLFRIVYLLLFSLLTLNCRKDNASVNLSESTDQALKKIKMVFPLSNSNTYEEVIEFQFDANGKIVAEGSKAYRRDNLQRIAEVTNSDPKCNYRKLYVHYSDSAPQQVAYTIAPWMGLEKGSDSILYVHDNNGLLRKTMTYVRQYAGTYRDTVNYYQFTLADSTWLDKYTVLDYDDAGNINRIRFYTLRLSGSIAVSQLCSDTRFTGYINTPNPQYSADEVRLADYSFYGTLNASKNNFSTAGDYSKSYEYRTDGRPRSCEVSANGKHAFTLNYVYE